MNKEKEIEEMVDVLWGHCGNLINEYCEGESHCANCIAKKLTDAGYRKAEEVRKETAKDIISAVLEGGFSTITEGDCLNFRQGYDVEEIHNFMIMLAKQYGVEVDE